MFSACLATEYANFQQEEMFHITAGEHLMLQGYREASRELNTCAMRGLSIWRRKSFS